MTGIQILMTYRRSQTNAAQLIRGPHHVDIVVVAAVVVVVAAQRLALASFWSNGEGNCEGFAQLVPVCLLGLMPKESFSECTGQ